MIPINELRIGNYVLIQGNIRRISLVSDDTFISTMPAIRFKGEQRGAIQSCDAANVQSVLLTEHILKQCGFVFHDYFRFWQLIDAASSQRSELDMDSDYNILDFMRRPIVKKVNSLHRLQNIYFALKGVDLNFQQDHQVVSNHSEEATLTATTNSPNPSQ
jgi:hypothetical protein